DGCVRVAHRTAGVRTGNASHRSGSSTSRSCGQAPRPGRSGATTGAPRGDGRRPQPGAAARSRRAARPPAEPRNVPQASRLAPGLPGRSSFVPELVQITVVAAAVHRVPETLVPVGHQLVVACKFMKRLALEREEFIVLEAVEEPAVEDEE